MVTRTRSSAAHLKATVAQGAQQHNEEVHASHSTIDDILSSFGLPSRQRAIIAFVANLLVSGTSIYLGMQLTAYMALGAAVLTGSAFLTFMVLFIGYTISIFAGVILGGKVQAFILDGSIDRTYESAKTKVTGWFGKAKAKVAGPDGAELRSKFGFSAR